MRHQQVQSDIELKPLKLLTWMNFSVNRMTLFIILAWIVGMISGYGFMKQKIAALILIVVIALVTLALGNVNLGTNRTKRGGFVLLGVFFLTSCSMLLV